MNLETIEAKMEEELIRDLEAMKTLSVGSKDHEVSAAAIKNLYSAMVTAKHNSDEIEVQKDKNEQESILKDEENRGRFELEKEKLELEKAKLERELMIREQQNRVSLVDCCLDSGVTLAKIAVGAAAFGALLTFETTGCVTSKGGLSWLTKMLF